MTPEDRKEFCPNCEAETPCTHEAELFVCDICGEDFAKYIVSRNCTLPDVSTTRDVLTPIKTSQSNENTNPDYYKHDAISAGKVSVDVKTSTDNNKRSKWKAYVPGWGAPTVNKRYLVKLINDWITIATYYLRVGGGYWKDDRGQELVDGVVSLWKGLEE